MGFFRPEYWGGYPFPSPGDLPNPSPRDLPNPGIEPRSPALQADSLPAEPQEKPFFFYYGCFIYIYIYGLNILYKNRLKSSQALMTALSLNIILFFSLLPPIHAFLICAQLLSHLVISDSLYPMDCSPPGSFVHEIFQARILEWVVISFSRGSS